MQRTQVYLTPVMVQEIHFKAKREHKSEAQVIRELIDRGLGVEGRALVSVVLRLPEELKRWLEEEAQREHSSADAIVRQAIANVIARTGERK